MILEAKHISFRYGTDSRQILNDFSLKLTQEERVGLIAPSGFGKTTFCKILAGYEKPDEGEVLLDGHSLAEYKGYCPVQMIWQHPEQVVNPRLRMKEVLAEGDHLEQRVIEGLGIEPDWLNRYPAELSGGELQRFCIARALGERTRFILADGIGTDYPESDLELSGSGSREPGDWAVGSEPQYTASYAGLYPGGRFGESKMMGKFDCYSGKNRLFL